MALIAVTSTRAWRATVGMPRTLRYVRANRSCQMRSTSNGSWPMTSGVIVLSTVLTVRSPSAPWNRKGPCASPIPTSPASVVSFTITSLTWVIACVDVRTTWGNGAEREYVSSPVIFMEEYDTVLRARRSSARSRHGQ